MIVLAATPLGNLGDASDRLRHELGQADVIAAEDTRRLHRLARDLGVGIVGRVVSHYEAVEQARSQTLLAAAQSGQRVLVVTDAGMPVVSDPGYRLIAAAVAADIPVTVIPGPSAVTTALAISGLPADRFCFEGFLPRKGGERRRRLTELAEEVRTMVFFESPRRTQATLAAMVEFWGDARAGVVCRELTKTYEEVRRGTLGQLHDWASTTEVLGEITLVIAGFDPTSQPAPTIAELAQNVSELMATGVDRKQAMLAVAQRHHLPKRQVYDAVLAARAAANQTAPTLPQPQD